MTDQNQVKLTITRKSDGNTTILLLTENTTIGELKLKIRNCLPPKYTNGCRLLFGRKILHSKRTLKHYGLTRNQAPPNILGNSNILMDDTKNWKCDSSSSSSEQSE